MDNNLLYIWLSLCCQYDNGLFDRIKKDFRTPGTVYEATEEQFREKGYTEKQIKRFCDKSFDEARKILEVCHKNDIGLITYTDKAFPKRLKEIPHCPVLLYYTGNLIDLEKEVAIGTVGTRTPSQYGKRIAYETSYDLSKGGAVIVSGMALGIDSICHIGCLDAGGKTVAVLGSGLKKIYPKENLALFERIKETGMVVTEYPPYQSALTYTFPQRNRIISGLSLGTLVIEANSRSGAMITAKKVIQQGRDLFATPGQLGEGTSTGPNNLIKNGAFAITSAKDILCRYKDMFPQKIKTDNMYSYTHDFSYNTPSPQKEVIFTDSMIEEAVEKYTLKQTKYQLDIDFDEEKPVKKEKPVQTKAKKAQEITEEKVVDNTLFDTLLSESEKKLYNYILEKGQATVDEMVFDGFSKTNLFSNLTMLEVKGIIEVLPGDVYSPKKH